MKAQLITALAVVAFVLLLVVTGQSYNFGYFLGYAAFVLLPFAVLGAIGYAVYKLMRK